MVYAYMRQVPNFENLGSQKSTILAFAHQQGIDIDQEVIEYAKKDLLLDQRDEFEQFLLSLDEGDYIVLVSSLNILSTKIDEMVKVINCMLSHDVDLWVCDAGLLINKESHMLEVFPLLEKHREKPKARLGLGRPKGTKSSSKFDIYHSQIMQMLAQKQNTSAIARTLDVSRSSLKDYIASRGLKTLVESMGLAAENLADKNVDNILVVCPFEADALAKQEGDRNGSNKN